MTTDLGTKLVIEMTARGYFGANHTWILFQYGYTAQLIASQGSRLMKIFPRRRLPQAQWSTSALVWNII